jgi:hypothetical protein
MSVARCLPVVLPAMLAGAVLSLMMSESVSGQTPLTPRSADTCTASLTVSPNVVLFGGPRPVAVQARGLEPGVSYALFFNSTQVISGSTTLDGTVDVNTTIDSLIALAVNVQVVTQNRCAAGTLTVAGPIRFTCDPMIVPGLPPFCVIR